MGSQAAYVSSVTWTIITVGNMLLPFLPSYILIAVSYTGHVTALLKTLQCSPGSVREETNIFTMAYKAHDSKTFHCDHSKKYILHYVLIYTLYIF